MTDQFGRTIDYIRISVTDRCNLRCIYCMPEEGVPCVPHAEILTYDEIARVCRIGTELGITKVRLTGGEPLVRRDLYRLVGMLRAIPAVGQISLTTNGIFLKQQISGLVRAGLDAVNISLDSLDEKVYSGITRGGVLQEALEGVEAAVRVPGLKVKINCVPVRGIREDTYIRLAELARDHNIDVRFIEMMPIGLGKKFTGISGEEIRKLLTEKFGPETESREQRGNGPAVYFHFRDFSGEIGFIDALSHKFCGSCNRVRLTSEGFLKPCLQYDAGADLKSMLRHQCSDEEIKARMYETVYSKPKGHHFMRKQDAEDLKDEWKGMSRIGG